MKFILLIFLVATLAACSSGSSDKIVDSKTKDSTTAAPVFLPYKMGYSAWTIGDPQNLKIVLDMYKDWDDNKSEAAAAAFGDSTIFDRATGVRTITTKETITDSLRTWRDALDTHSTEIISGISLHSSDKNEDWVTVQSLTRWKTKDGDTDSSLSTDNWLIKNGKIVYLASFEQRQITNP